MKFKKHINALIFFLVIFTFSLTNLTLAQTSPKDLQSLIQQLQEQIKQLQSQVIELQSQVEISKKEIELVKTELKFTKALRLGTRGDEVEQLQEFLKQFPDIYPQGLITGYFGPLTEAAVRKFQEKQGIESIGVVGPKTLSKLNELITEGAGKSDKIPPGLLIAPGIQKKFATTTPLTSTSTVSLATTTPAGTIPATPATPATSATPAVPTVTSATPAISATPATPAQPAAAATTASTTPTTT
ncbi:MAG: peptidoglycan-binding protein, partial [Nanoarchaeota archaeon]